MVQRSRREYLIRSGLLIAAGCMLLSGCGKKTKPAADPTPTQADADTKTAAPTREAASDVRILAPEEGTFAFEKQQGESEVHVGPTATPTPLPTPTPEPTPEASEEPVVMQPYDLSALRARTYTAEEEAQIEAFYDGAVFAGDSVLLGFKNYCARSSDPLLSKLGFLAAGSFSLHNAFWPVSSESVHPLYQGQQYPLWESVNMMGAKKLFLFFGINDVAWGVQDSIGLYSQLVDKIHELTPGVEINILSTTYTLKDKGKGGITNDNISLFNSGVVKLAGERGWGYIDLATALSDGQGNLAEPYCSDGFLHESAAAYEVWTMMIRAYAAERLGFGGGTMPQPGAGDESTSQPEP